MNISPDPATWPSRQQTPSTLPNEHAEGPASHGELTVTRVPLLTVKLAAGLADLPVRHLRLECRASRRALRHIVRWPGLQTLEVVRLWGPGPLAHFDSAPALETFKARGGLSATDLQHIARATQLRELGAQNARLSPSAVAAVAAMPQLASLDLHDSDLDDRMARQLARSTTITTLRLSATTLSADGLAHVARMTQLRSLDLWATYIDETDLPLLSALPNLEELSIGQLPDMPPLDPAHVTRWLLGSPTLKRVWLDGVDLDDDQVQALESRLESVMVILPRG